MGLLRSFCGPWLQDGPGIFGFAVVFLALGGPILLFIGAIMFALHGTDLVMGEAELYAVQNDFWNPLMTPAIFATYSWCTYSLRGTCPDGTSVNITAQRDDLAYNGIGGLVPFERCFTDAIILNDPQANEQWTANNCLDAQTGYVTCTNPRPIVRSWFQRDACASGRRFSWTLNDPGESHPRFIAITVAGAVATVLGLGPMCGLWIKDGCDFEGDSYM